uniref:USP domain-containing protein n=1 Tax=Hyaloperonospora arabidopsidis (strain Emoy2) TaxID=559515 RepID=M4C6R4_HYAAE
MAEVPRLLFRWSWLTWLALAYWNKTKLYLLYYLTLWVWRPLVTRLGSGRRNRLAHEALDEGSGPSSFDYSVTTAPGDAVIGPSGLVNIGNLCFVNAVLQCLATVPEFVESVDRALRTRNQLYSSQIEDDTIENKVLVAETLVSLLKGIGHEVELDVELEADGEQDHLSRLARDDNQQKLRSFRSAASRCTYLVSSAASRQEQQDAEEFLSFLLELLHDLLRVPAQPTRQEEERQRFLQSEDWFLQQLKKYDPNDPRSYIQAVAQTVRGSQCCSCANLTCLHEEQR